MAKLTLDQFKSAEGQAEKLADQLGLGPAPSSGPTSRRVAPEAPPPAYLPAPIGVPPVAPTEAQAASRQALWEGYGLWDAVKDSWQADSLIFSTIVAAQESGFRLDPSWRLPDEGTEEWKILTEGIPEEFHENLAVTLSADHAQFKADKIREELEVENRLMEFGGIGGRIALGLTNPENILAAMATGGAGWVKAAPTLGKAAARSAALGAAGNVAIDAPLAAMQETRGTTDVVFSAAAGMLLGGTVGALGRYLSPADQAKFVRDARKEMDDYVSLRDSKFTPFGADSAGAARAGSVARPLIDDFKLQATGEYPTPNFNRLRVGPWRDLAADVHDVDDRELRNAIGGYVGDPAGTNATGAVVPIGANEEATTLRAVRRAQVARDYEPAFKAWARTAGRSSWDAMARREFGEAVTLHRLGYAVSEDPAIVRAAGAMDKFYDDFLTDAVEAGVKGVQKAAGGKYRPRVWLKQAVSEFSTAGRFGAATIDNLIARAFAQANEDVSEEIAEKVGRTVANTLRRSHANMTEITVGFRKADGEWLEGLIREVNKDGSLDDVQDYLKRAFSGLLEKSGRTAEGGQPHQKHRMLLDETASIEAVDNATGKLTKLHLYDLFDNDAGELADIYGHRMAGAVGFARRAKVFDKTDHEKLLDQVRSHYEARGDVKKGEKVATAMDEVYKLAHGQSLANPAEPPAITQIRRVARAMRDLAFSARMNMMWVAALPDSSAWLVSAQAKRLFRYLPELRQLFKQAKDGTVDHKFMQEIIDNTGIATEGMANDIFSAFDDDLIRQHLGRGATGLERLQSAVERMLRKANRITSHVGGVYWKQNFDQKLFGAAYATRIIDNALGKSTDLDPKRLASAGLNKAMLKRIGAMVEAHSDTQPVKGGLKVKSLNTEAWTDREAASALWGAVAREGRRSVQSEAYGEAPRWMNYAWGKVLGQFRRFGMVATTKQLLYGVRHADMETLQRVLAWQMPLGMLGYMGQMYAYSLTQPDPQAFRDKYLTEGHVLWAGFARAGFVGLLPAISQGLFETATGTSINSNTRVSGSGTSFLDLNTYPAIDMLWRFMKAGETMLQSTIRGDRQFDQKDFRNLRGVAPLQNAPGVKQALDMIQNLLPETDDDVDPDSAEWFWE